MFARRCWGREAILNVVRRAAADIFPIPKGVFGGLWDAEELFWVEVWLSHGGSTPRLRELDVGSGGEAQSRGMSGSLRAKGSLSQRVL